MAKIMVVAGGDWQCPIIRTAKSMGHYVVCSNLYEGSPGFRYSDVGEAADVLDREKNLEIARKHQINAVLTDQSDIAVPTVAYVAEKMGLRGIGTKKAYLFTNKYAMREFCREHGFPHPQYQLCHSYGEAEKFFRKMKKAIIKPLDSQSSRGIHITETEGQLKGHFMDALQYSNSCRAVLAEQYIEGKEFTVDGIKNRDGYYVTAISKKEPFGHNPGIAKELLFSNYDEEYDYDELRRLNRQMVLEMGLPFGLTHAEYKYMDGKFYLIEIAARGGGTKISSSLVPVMSGVDSNKLYIDMLLGREEEIKVNYRRDRYALLGFFDLKPGKIDRIDGLGQAGSVDGVLEIGLNFSAGDTVGRAVDDRSRAGYYIICADSYEGLRGREVQMKRTLRLQYGSSLVQRYSRNAALACSDR